VYDNDACGSGHRGRRRAGMGFDLGSINSKSPQFQAADRACQSIAAHAKG
jgi:hypothetical protein